MGLHHKEYSIIGSISGFGSPYLGNLLCRNHRGPYQVEREGHLQRQGLTKR